MNFKNTNNFKKLAYPASFAAYILGLILLVDPVAFAQQRNVSIKTGATSKVTLAPNESTKIVNFVFFSNSPKITTLDITLEAPKKTKFSAKSLGVSKRTSLAAALSRSKSMYVQEVAAYGGKLTKQLTIGSGSGSGGNSNGGQRFCNGFAPIEYRDAFYAEYKRLEGRFPHNDEECCDYFFDDAWRAGGGGSGGGSGNSSTLRATSHVLKDSCAKAGSFKYIVVLSADISKIPSGDRSKGHTMSISVKEKAYNRGTATSIKPHTPEGKFKGQTLALAELTSYSDKHMYIRWSSGSVKRITSRTTKNLGKITPHMGKVYGVSLPKEQMRGGRLTLSPFTTNDAYGVCISAIHRRQCYNGYRGGDCK